MVTCRVWKERKWMPATKMGTEERREHIQRSIQHDSFLTVFLPGLHYHFDLSLWVLFLGLEILGKRVTISTVCLIRVFSAGGDIGK